jgi:TPR repeat protein
MRGNFMHGAKGTGIRQKRSLKESRLAKNEDLFTRADEKSNRGEIRSAFRLFLAAARAGHRASQLNVGYCYQNGIGVRANRNLALHWYRLAYRRGDASAANNIGTIWRDDHELKRALSWFEKAVKLGNEGSNLQIAKLHLMRNADPRKAIDYLERVKGSDHVAEVEVEEANRLLAQARRKMMASLRGS